jgi:hypothetical protein
MSGSYRKIKMGQTPGDLPPEKRKDFDTPGAREVVRRKTKSQLREQERVEIQDSSDE